MEILSLMSGLFLSIKARVSILSRVTLVFKTIWIAAISQSLHLSKSSSAVLFNDLKNLFLVDMTLLTKEVKPNANI